MRTEVEIKIDRELEITPSIYLTPGRIYTRPGWDILYSPRLLRTSRGYYGTMQIIETMIEFGTLPEGTRPMLQSEAYALERSCLKQGIEPRYAVAFADYFGHDNALFEITGTGLRTPGDWEGGRKDTGTGKYPRLVLEFGDVVGFVQVPESSGEVVVETDPVFGIPTKTQKIWSPDNHLSHFTFDPGPPLDRISGHHDVAIGRWGGCHPGESHYRCLDVVACFGRSGRSRFDSFRPVIGIASAVREIQTDPRVFIAASSRENITIGTAFPANKRYHLPVLQ